MKTKSAFLKILPVAALLLVVLIAAHYAVTHFRRPGAMTPIEVQAMDMSVMKPPIGAVPVAVYRARWGGVTARVTYTGSALPFNDETIYPRVTGRILSLPVYPGMRVRAGDLVVRLDSAELGAKEQQALYARKAAGHDRMIAVDDIDKAKSGNAQAQSEAVRYQGMAQEVAQNLVGSRAAVDDALAAVGSARQAVRQAQSEVAVARQQKAEALAGQDEAHADLADAEKKVEAKRADVARERARLTRAQAEIDSAQADVDFLREKAARTAELYKGGAVSKEEYQSDTARFHAAEAKLNQTGAGVEEAKAAIAAAEAEVRQAQSRVVAARAKVQAAGAKGRGGDAQIRVADAKVAQMQAEVRRAQAKLAQSRAEVAATTARLQQARAGVKTAGAVKQGTAADLSKAYQEAQRAEALIGQASAQLTEARVVRGYTEIRASTDGLVTQRLVAPGVLVNAGTPILKIAQIDPIRLQVNVAVNDLTQLRAGMPVTVHIGEGGTVQARISAVFPSTDSASRTGIVEAVVPNALGRFKPGQYVVMDLAMAAPNSSIKVPSSAVILQNVASSDVIATRQESAIWIMERVQTGKPVYTCTMHPEVRSDKPGKCPKCGMPLTPLEAGGAYRARLLNVRTGADDGDYVQVLGGLSPNAEVIYKGYESLKDGDPVIATAWGVDGPVNLPAAGGSGLDGMNTNAQATSGKMQVAKAAAPGVQEAKVTVTQQGYQPDVLQLKAGVSARVTFTRITDATCATDVLFPDYGIRRSLPLNKPVVVTFTPKKGRFNFMCGMEMVKGTAIVR